MRKVRLISLTLIAVALAGWILYSSIPTSAKPTQVAQSTSSLCERIDWYNAPSAFGGRQWVASYDGAYDNHYRTWQRMSDSERATALTECGKERP